MEFPSDTSLTCTQTSASAASPPSTLPRTSNSSAFSVPVAIPPDPDSDSPPPLPTLVSSIHEALLYQAWSFALSIFIAALMTALIWAVSRVDWRSRDANLYGSSVHMCAWSRGRERIASDCDWVELSRRGGFYPHPYKWGKCMSVKRAPGVYEEYICEMSLSQAKRADISPSKTIHHQPPSPEFPFWFYFVDGALGFVTQSCGAFLAGWEIFGTGRRNQARAKHAFVFMLSEVVITGMGTVYGFYLIPVYETLSVGFTTPGALKFKLGW
ncbi:hypothetical protein BDK51DRAFT_35304 [Blyttiomyces helicus]|uniref:Uncharacterized protein n=1 Tax=Blyttiomyces helicus TaxID=388810 RepID=A0A4P9WDZ6_9FUNG|nr:hypothetical protein BDK51DRAFT_35304 [Blyttiomyces helicus]|eukprot:RKO89903.1 hypothetical protein BDK51DRAFT_35304 [Blyttiomyces helicus]